MKTEKAFEDMLSKMFPKYPKKNISAAARELYIGYLEDYASQSDEDKIKNISTIILNNECALRDGITFNELRTIITKYTNKIHLNRTKKRKAKK